MKTTDKFILDENHNPVAVDLLTWAEWFEAANRTVAQTNVGADVLVSTVFLGIDHSFSPFDDGPLILFETMVFGGEFEDEMNRYATWDEAVAGHEAMVKVVKLLHRFRQGIEASCRSKVS